jgi:hypothetical protein
MKPLVLIYPKDNIFEDVKQEASLYAERKYDKEGTPIFEQLVFDEEYDTKFRELFLDARAAVGGILAPHMKGVPSKMGYFEQTDYEDMTNCRYYLSMRDNWNSHYRMPLDTNIRQFFIAYIMYRWLETKAPEDAAIYYQRCEKLKEEIKTALDAQLGVLRRKHTYWE